MPSSCDGCCMFQNGFVSEAIVQDNKLAIKQYISCNGSVSEWMLFSAAKVDATAVTQVINREASIDHFPPLGID